MWPQTQNVSIKNFTFRKYLCRTFGNSCRLHGKHMDWETLKTLAMFNLIKKLHKKHNIDSIRTYKAAFKKFQCQCQLEAIYDLQ